MQEKHPVIRWKSGKPTYTHLHKNGDVIYLTFEPLEQFEWLEHAFSTRFGGVSGGEWTSMNLCFDRGDDPENVRQNFYCFCHAAGMDASHVVTSDQTHTTNLREASVNDRGAGLTRPLTYHDIDGLYTDQEGVILFTEYADCVPLYFVDPVHKAIALSHSGWHGTADGIGSVTLKTMANRYGTDPADVTVVIGPSICQDCYEVSEDVAQQFPDECLINKENGKYQLDLWKANYLMLRKGGVREENIFMPEICTCCNPQFLFSHRASHGRRGNLGAFIGIR